MASSSAVSITVAPIQPGRILSPEASRQFQVPFRPRVKSSNLSDIYKNPKLLASLLQSGTSTPWSSARLFLFLTPCFVFQFVFALCALFSTLNLKTLDTTSRMEEFEMLHLVLGGMLSVALTISSQKMVQKFIGSRKNTVVVFFCHVIYLFMGLTLVFAANLERISIVLKNNTEVSNWTSVLTSSSASQVYDIPSSSTSQVYDIPSSSASQVYDIPLSSASQVYDIPLSSASQVYDIPSSSASQVYDMLNNPSKPTSWAMSYFSETSGLGLVLSVSGYVILISSASSGQYLLTSIAMSTAEERDYGRILFVSILISGLGGCTLSILGFVSFLPDTESLKDTDYVLFRTFGLVCAALGLLVSSSVCCISAWFHDVISSLLRNAKETDTNGLAPCDRRPTKTAQEIYDECAPLLADRARGMLHSNSLELDRSLTETRDISNTVSQSDTFIDDSCSSSNQIKQPAYVVPVVPSLSRSQKLLLFLKRQRNLSFALLLTLFLASSGVSFEFYSTTYMTLADGQADDMRGLTSGTQQACMGLSILYLTFTCVHCVYDLANRYIEWRRLAIGFSLLASIWTLVLASKHVNAVFYIVAFVQGLFKVTALSLPQLLTTQAVRSPISFRKSFVLPTLLEISMTSLWCMPAVGLIVYSLIALPLFQATGLLAIPMYYSAIAAILSCIGLLRLL
ncbi:uncharacterized protein LOC129927437 [Biomphalaria glabrata]|uniref:Uncharacterized protein LOC129927437 n=1 Tax=Biomphalaria glabrata TaxID=6526 RepID=A0A9W3AZI9_BIOGL|nr:uncharacterized protein LOC129927437 [Biomphalaria glabrata]